MVALLAAALLATPRVRANPAQNSKRTPQAAERAMAAVIEIERAPGSEVCPDSESVFRSIARLFPERAFQRSTDVYTSAASARVSIRPLTSGHEARMITLLPRRGERVIVERDQDCHGLADALALAFVMLVQAPDSNSPLAVAGATSAASERATPLDPATRDSGSKSPLPNEATPSRALVCAPASARAPSSGARIARGARRVRTEVDASIVGGYGVLDEPALGAAAGVELYDQSGWGFSLQGVRLWSLPAEVRGGSITFTLWGLLLGPCYRAQLGAASRLDACLRLGVGSQYVAVEQFLTPQPGNFPWLTLTPTLGYGLGFTESLSGFLRIGPIVQLRSQSFSVIDGAGAPAPMVAGPSVGVLAELGLNFGEEFLLTRFEQWQ